MAATKRASANGKTAQPSLRERLAAKRSRTTSIRIPIGEDGQAAEREYNEASQAVAAMKWLSAQGKQTDLAAAEKRLAVADEELERNALRLTFRGLSPDEVDALRSEFTREDDDGKFDFRGYTCALLAAATVDSDLTAEDWDVELFQSGRWSDGEVEAIREAARAAYLEAPAAGIPKG